MDWIMDVVTSEFIWGIVIGLLLSVVISIVTANLAYRRQQRVVAAFCQDLIASVSELIASLDENVDRNRVIRHEFIENIAAELVVYGRNREHLIHIRDARLRKDIRMFFTDVTSRLAVVRVQLAQYYECWREYQREPSRVELKEAANSYLAEAHRVCDRLRALAEQREAFDKRLQQ